MGNEDAHTLNLPFPASAYFICLPSFSDAGGFGAEMFRGISKQPSRGKHIRGWKARGDA